MLTVSRRILVSAPRDSVQRYLADLREIAKYESKVDAIEVAPGADGASAAVAGHFLGLPWRGTFRIEPTRDGGYAAAMVSGPLRRMESRVLLRPVAGGTQVDHIESYELPFLLKPFQFLIRRWLDHTLESELDFIKEGAEALNRRRHIESLDV